VATTALAVARANMVLVVFAADFAGSATMAPDFVAACSSRVWKLARAGGLAATEVFAARTTIGAATALVACGFEIIWVAACDMLGWRVQWPGQCLRRGNGCGADAAR
jgi:hypothetical protein